MPRGLESGEGFVDRGDVGGGCPAASADDRSACLRELHDRRGEFLGADGEDGLSVDELRHPCVRLDDDGLRRDPGEALHERKHPVRA